MQQKYLKKKREISKIAAGILATALLASSGQPLMAFASEKIQTNDPSASEQWAFFNDGSFAAEEMRKYPVYSDPFGQPTENAESAYSPSYSPDPKRPVSTGHPALCDK